MNLRQTTAMSDAMLQDLTALVECESPTEDLEACNRVIELAGKISERVTGIKGDPIGQTVSKCARSATIGDLLPNQKTGLPFS